MDSKFKSELDNLLSENATTLKNRINSAFDQLNNKHKNSIVLFGAGNLGKKVLNSLRDLGIEPIALSDNNPLVWGKNIEGIKVLSPHDVVQWFGTSATFIITIWNAEGKNGFLSTREQLSTMGCKNIVSFIPLFWKYSKTFLPYYCIDLPHKIIEQKKDVRKVLSLWEDDTSREEYVSQLRWRMHLDFDSLSEPENYEQYFPDDIFASSSEEVFVDCGAFNGDTIRIFLERQSNTFSKIFALEPDPMNFNKLLRFISTLDDTLRAKVILLEAAAGEYKQKVNIEVTGTTSSSIGAGKYAIDCIPLDDLFYDEIPTFIKMDIEGYELEALAGASKIINRHNPILAISVYHHPDHLWSIPLYINSLTDNYHLFLRSHGQEGWDLICYAIPHNRLRA
ncbi:FkbM family methyltransferase [Chloroflexota bacterium]